MHSQLGNVIWKRGTSRVRPWLFIRDCILQ